MCFMFQIKFAKEYANKSIFSWFGSLSEVVTVVFHPCTNFNYNNKAKIYKTKSEKFICNFLIQSFERTTQI
jgi:hypothetical protein